MLSVPRAGANISMFLCAKPLVRDTPFFFFFICLLSPDFVYYKFVFSIINNEFWLWGVSGKCTDRRRYDIAMHY